MPLSPELLLQLQREFLHELDGRVKEARGHLESVAAAPADAGRYRPLERFFHNIAGTAASAGLPMLGHLAVVCERAAQHAGGGQGSTAIVEQLALGLEGVASALAGQPGATAPGSARPRSAALATAVRADALALAKILVVDDDRFSASYTENCLRAAGFQSATCTEPGQALAAIQAELPDLVILDVMMPGVDGFELCRQVRGHPALHLTPIIFVTRSNDVDQRVRGLEVGANDYVSKPFEPTELVARVRSHLQRLADLREMAIRDGLTRCFNHKYFKARLDQEITRARQEGSTLAVGMIDVDFFKRINDTHGHPAGDAVLMNLASLVSASVRSSDVVARYGGEEFGVLLVQAGVHEARVIAERMRARVESHPFELPGASNVPVTVSVGLTELGAGDTRETLLQRADGALYRSKSSGRNRVTTA